MRRSRTDGWFGLAAPILLAGLLPLQQDDAGRWPIAGAWRYPVGDPYVFGAPSSPASPAFSLSRGLQWTRGRLTHEGADLVNGRGGDTVFAAAGGIVVAVATGPGEHGGYGNHVLLAHRLPDGTLVYSMYAHLARGTIVVRAGRPVAAGDMLARVGRTGRATTPHLHFEVREAGDALGRWQSARCHDPLTFVGERLASSREDTSWARPYLEWAEDAGMLAEPIRGDAPLTRAAWWRALAGATRGACSRVSGGATALRDSLIEDGLLPDEEWHADPNDEATWRDVVRDLKRARRLGLRSPAGPLFVRDHRDACESRFDEPSPADALGRIAKRKSTPTVADACLLVADAAGPREEPERPAAKRVRSKSTKPHRRTGDSTKPRRS